MGVDEIYLGKSQKFLYRGEQSYKAANRCGFGWERAWRALRPVFCMAEQALGNARGSKQLCVDMHEPFRLSLEQWVPRCSLGL